MTKNENVSSALVDELRELLKMSEKLIQEVKEEWTRSQMQYSEAAVQVTNQNAQSCHQKKNNKKLKTFCTSQKAILYQN